MCLSTPCNIVNVLYFKDELVVISLAACSIDHAVNNSKLTVIIRMEVCRISYENFR